MVALKKLPLRTVSGQGEATAHHTPPVFFRLCPASGGSVRECKNGKIYPLPAAFMGATAAVYTHPNTPSPFKKITFPTSANGNRHHNCQMASSAT